MHDYQTSASLTKIKSFNCLRLIKSMESVLLYFLILQNLLTCKDNSSVLIMAAELAICWNVAFEEDDHQEYLLYSGQSINLPPCKAKFLNVPESYFGSAFIQHPPFLQASLMLILFAPFAPLTLTHKFYVTNSQVRNMSGASVSRNIR